VSFYPLVQQRRYHAMGAWVQNLLMCGVHVAGAASLGFLAVRCPERYRLALWPLALLCGGVSGLAVWYHWTAASDLVQEVL